MRQRIDLEQMPRFWPPKPSGLWDVLLGPLHRRFLRGVGIVDVQIDGMEKLSAIDPADGILLCPNHSYTGDGPLMVEFGRQMPRRMYIMAAWHGFRGMWGISGWFLQRMGAFSVDREGCDRRAIKQAMELLTTGKALCIFPEGEIYHTNERLTPLREGVAFIAATAQRELDKAKSPANVWLVPLCIRYRFVGDVLPELKKAMTALEERVLLTPRPDLPLHERIIRFGELALMIKEKEHLGQAGQGTLPDRLSALARHILARREQTHLNKVADGEPIPVRVKMLRQHLLESVWEQDCAPEAFETVREALGDVHLALQLYSYPGDYISSEPSIERMAETIEKYEEDVFGKYATPKGDRIATVAVGGPIGVKQHSAAGRLRAVVGDLTAKLESSLRALVDHPR